MLGAHASGGDQKSASLWESQFAQWKEGRVLENSEMPEFEMLAPLLIGCVASSKPLNLSEPLFFEM